MKLSNLDGIQAVNQEEQQLTGGFDLAALLAAITPFLAPGNFATSGGQATASTSNPFLGTSTSVGFQTDASDGSSFSAGGSSSSVFNPFI